MRFLSLIKQTWSFDPRSLAFYRFLMGIVVMSDVLYRLPDLVDHYTDVGLIPRALFLNEMSMPWSASFHLVNGSAGWAMIMMGIHFLCGFCLMIGLKTRLSTIGAFVMTVSLHNRNWLINNGGDDILRAVLCLSIFLPLGQLYSVDRALTKNPNPAKSFFSTWGMAFFFQIFAVYFISYILKDHAIWRSDFTAVYYASQLDIFQSDFGLWIRQFPALMMGMSVFTIFLEWLGPLLIYFSFLGGKFWWLIRLFTIICFVALHVGIATTMKIGVFPYLCMSIWMIFLPPQFWDFIFNKLNNGIYPKLKIYFDGECGFCKKGVYLLREFFLLSNVTIDQAQDYPAIHDQMVKNHSWVVVNGQGEQFFRFAAAFELFRHSPILKWFTPFFRIPFIFSVGDKIYIWISNHRPLMGKMTQFLEWSSAKKEIITWRWFTEALGLFMFILLFAWNLSTIKKLDVRFPKLQSMVRWIHLYQEWNMFAPFPKTDNIWVEVYGTLSNGEQVEILTQSKDLYSVKNMDFYKQIPNEKWRKFYLNVSENVTNAKYLAAFWCRRWNERQLGFVPDTTLRTVQVKVFSQLNFLDYVRGEIKEKHSWRHWCFDEDYRRDNPNN